MHVHGITEGLFHAVPLSGKQPVEAFVANRGTALRLHELVRAVVALSPPKHAGGDVRGDLRQITHFFLARMV